MGQERIGCALVGYGTKFNWGWTHAHWIEAVEALRLLAVCTRTAESAIRARRDFPGVDTYTDLSQMLTRDDIELISVLTPHNTHAAIVIECLNAGKHVIVDKAMAITVAECDRNLWPACGWLAISLGARPAQPGRRLRAQAGVAPDVQR
jgi:predicted dehydrogenase